MPMRLERKRYRVRSHAQAVQTAQTVGRLHVIDAQAVVVLQQHSGLQCRVAVSVGVACVRSADVMAYSCV